MPADFLPAQPVVPFEDRMRTLKHGILARPILERVIREIGLYPDLRNDLDGAVAQLRRDVEIRLEGEVPGGPPSLLFVVEVRGRDREKVAKAAELLPRLYADMTRAVMQDQARALREVLDSQTAELARQLTADEQKILAFKIAHLDELPESVETSARAAGRAEALIEMRIGTLADARRRRDATLAAVPDAPSEPGLAEAGLDGAARRYAAARAAYGDASPDVKRAKREYEEALARRDQGRVAFRKERIEPQLERIAGEVAEDEAALRQLREELARYQKRMEAAPRRAAELAVLSRDYETLKAKYAGTVSRRADAQTAEALLAADSAGLFRVLQPAIAPEQPVAPDRARLLWMALAVALASGLAAAGAAEWLDRSLRGPEDASVFGVPVLAAIPRIGPGGRRVS
jgi:uncharacterized protein involved in exopolysaccharide biosynthesis